MKYPRYFGKMIFKISEIFWKKNNPDILRRDGYFPNLSYLIIDQPWIFYKIDLEKYMQIEIRRYLKIFYRKNKIEEIIYKFDISINR